MQHNLCIVQILSTDLKTNSVKRFVSREIGKTEFAEIKGVRLLGDQNRPVRQAHKANIIEHSMMSITRKPKRPSNKQTQKSISFLSARILYHILIWISGSGVGNTPTLLAFLFSAEQV